MGPEDFQSSGPIPLIKKLGGSKREIPLVISKELIYTFFAFRGKLNSPNPPKKGVRKKDEG
jgi:hypothetical protein